MLQSLLALLVALLAPFEPFASPAEGVANDLGVNVDPNG